jgi:hypothetical protein
MLVTPDVIEDACISLLQRRHPEHLAALERQRDLPPQTIERLATIDVLAAQGFRERQDTPPACLVGVFGPAGAPEENKNRKLDITWDLAMQIVVIGTDRRDTLRRRGWYAMTIVECVMSRLPRDCDPISRLQLMDIDLINGAAEASQRTVGEARLLFEVNTRNAIDLEALPLDSSLVPAGTPGGPPGPTPYDPPQPWPPVTTVIENVDKV